MSDSNDDVYQRMPLPELQRFVHDLCRTYGVTEEERQRLDRMSLAELEQMLRACEDKRRGDAGSPGA